MSQMSNTNEKPCFLISWSTTGKRGREPTSTNNTPTTTISSYSSSSFSYSYSEEEEEEEEEAEAEEAQTAHFLLMLSSSINTPPTTTMTSNCRDHEDHHQYRCESCGKSFSSYQALGGHRAGHFKNSKARNNTAPHHHHHHVDVHDQQNEKKSGGGIGETEVRFDDQDGGVLVLKKKMMSHECPICNMGFSSGQALGGHKRRHWARKTTSACMNHDPNDNNVGPEPEVENTNIKKKTRKKKSRLISSLCLDLNLPPPLSDKEEEEEKEGDKWFSIAAAAVAEVSSAPPPPPPVAASPLMASYCYC